MGRRSREGARLGGQGPFQMVTRKSLRRGFPGKSWAVQEPQWLTVRGESADGTVRTNGQEVGVVGPKLLV